MTWLDTLHSAAEGKEWAVGVRDAATPAALDKLESKVGAPLPRDLRDLLSETDGAQMLMLPKRSVAGWFVWPVKEITTRTKDLQKRVKKVHADTLVFFAPADDVVFAIDPGGHVFSWYPIDQEVVPVAASLAEWVAGWVSGRLGV